MDTALKNGDIELDGRGYPIKITGMEEILQRVYIRLSVNKGSFIYDRSFGSELRRLSSQMVNLNEKALNLARDAVADMSGVMIASASAEVTEKGIKVRVMVVVGKQSGEVEVVV